MMNDRFFKFPDAAKRDAAVNAWLDARTGELGETARYWFDVMRACGDDIREVMHDLMPTACVGEVAFCYVNAFTSHVNVGFFYGSELDDPAGLLEGTGKFMRHVKVGPGRNVSKSLLRDLVQAAYRDVRLRIEASKV